MGLLSSLTGATLYLDTNVFVYACEGFPDFSDSLRELFAAIDAGNISAVTSELTLAELLVKPFMDGDAHRQSIYNDTIRNSEQLSVFPITRDILIEAARLRSASTLRLPDAIHVATACSAGCTLFLTNDKRISTIVGIKVILLSEL
jgi:predicted nucleic acid-binding protein